MKCFASEFSSAETLCGGGGQHTLAKEDGFDCVLPGGSNLLTLTTSDDLNMDVS